MKSPAKPTATGKLANKKEASQNATAFFGMMDDKYSDLTIREQAARLGITYVYFMALRRGDRPTEKVGVEVVRRFAVFMEMSPLVVSFYLGVFENRDFEVATTLESKLEWSFDNMKRHQTWGMYLPSKAEFGKLDENLQVLMVLMFNQLEKNELGKVGLVVGQVV